MKLTKQLLEDHKLCFFLKFAIFCGKTHTKYRSVILYFDQKKEIVLSSMMFNYLLNDLSLFLTACNRSCITIFNIQNIVLHWSYMQFRSFGGSRALHLFLFCHTFNSALFENRVDEGDWTGDGMTCKLQKLIFDAIMSRCCPLIGVFNGLGSPVNVFIIGS